MPNCFWEKKWNILLLLLLLLNIMKEKSEREKKKLNKQVIAHFDVCAGVYISQ
jgi:hypothetical protein